MKKLKILITFLFVFNLILVNKVFAESFQFPSSGYIGWLYGYNTGTAEGTHTGIDIWTQKNGGWINGQSGQSNSVYAAYSGTIVFKGDNPNTGDGYIINHSPGLYSAYWHIMNKTKNLNDYISQGGLLGNQQWAEAVHVHFAILSAGSDNFNNAFDPSSYLGRQLKYGESGAPGWLDTYITSGSGCGGNDVIIQNQTLTGNQTCTAHNSIQLLPDTGVNPGNEIIFNIN